MAWLALSILALVLAAGLAVTIGPAEVSLTDVARSLAGHLGLPGAAEVAPLTDSIVWQLRLPRVLTAAAVGAGLALSGAVMQSVTRNPLADPYLLGLSSGASLGAVGVIVLGVAVALPAAAFLGALAALVATL
ncbi:MAG TPA: iron chelate uptake ABC transporter family permease subunit, partial [Cryobacterium sp.]|nr:iron chelate uptake ABC transporter family permease subunit [Cryobacterium sp.]